MIVEALVDQYRQYHVGSGICWSIQGRLIVQKDEGEIARVYLFVTGLR